MKRLPRKTKPGFPRFSLKKWLENKTTSFKTKVSLKKRIVDLQRDMRLSGVDFKNIPVGRIPCKKLSGYYGYLCETARKSI